MLVTITPLMYREILALSLQRARPDLAEVRIAPPEAAGVQIASFPPHLLICDQAHGSDAPIPEDALAAVPCRVELLHSSSGCMHARVCTGGWLPYEIRDVSAEDLIGAVDGAASLAKG